LQPTHSTSEPSTSGAQSLQWETVRERVLECGTLDRLVECVTTETGEFDSRHFNVLFATYRPLASADDVLARLVRRYKRVESGDLPCANEAVRRMTLE